MSCASRLLSAFSGVQAFVSNVGRGCDCGVAGSSGWDWDMGGRPAAALDAGGVEGTRGSAGTEDAAGWRTFWRWIHWIWPLALRTMTGTVRSRGVYHDICVNGPPAGVVLDVDGAVKVAGTETEVDAAGAATAGGAGYGGLVVC